MQHMYEYLFNQFLNEGSSPTYCMGICLARLLCTNGVSRDTLSETLQNQLGRLKATEILDILIVIMKNVSPNDDTLELLFVKYTKTLDKEKDIIKYTHLNIEGWTNRLTFMTSMAGLLYEKQLFERAKKLYVKIQTELASSEESVGQRGRRQVT